MRRARTQRNPSCRGGLAVRFERAEEFIHGATSFRPRGEAKTSAAGAQFLLDFYRAGRVTFLAARFLPDEGITIDAARNRSPRLPLIDLSGRRDTVALRRGVIFL
jgi:hypothetical protein